MEQVREYRVNLDNAHTPVQVLKQALPVFQIPKSFLVSLVLLIHAEKFKGILDFLYVCATKSKLQADIVLHFFVVHITRVLRDEVNSGVHGTSGTNQLVRKCFPLCHL